MWLASSVFSLWNEQRWDELLFPNKRIFLESELLRKIQLAIRNDNISGQKLSSTESRENLFDTKIRRIEKRSAEESKKKTSQPKKGVGKSTK